MNLAFLLGSPDINGGTYVIYEHAFRLKNRGHRVNIVTKHGIDPSRYAWHPGAGELEWQTIASAGEEHFDFVIATWYQSALEMKKLRASNYVYFVQSIESRFFPKEDPSNLERRDINVARLLRENTYLFPVPIITEASWIREYLSATYNREVELVRNGIRKDIYKQEGKCHRHPVPGLLRVLVEGPLGVPYKNVERTIELCLQSDADEVWLMTSTKIDTYYPDVNRVFSRVPICETPPIYRSCDVLLKLTYVEGMFGPPLEMFHCGGTAIVYDVTGVDEYIVHNRNSLVVKRDDEPSVVRCLNNLKSEPETLDRLKAGARETAKNWPDWEVSTQNFEHALMKFKADTRPKRAHLTRFTRYLSDSGFYALRNRELKRFAIRENEGSFGDQPIHNFIQLYWHSGEGFSEIDSLWAHYNSGDWVVCSFKIPSTTIPLYLRIDPSVRIGVILLQRIRVFIAETDRTLMNFTTSGDWEKLVFGGSAISLRQAPYPILESVGEDPQIILPSLKNIPNNRALMINIKLKEVGFREILKEYINKSETMKRGGGDLLFRIKNTIAKLKNKVNLHEWT